MSYKGISFVALESKPRDETQLQTRFAEVLCLGADGDQDDRVQEGRHDKLAHAKV
ncbi:hypothetical protein Scep_014500 [Stephania cephalantha]|uniref:Uncharacterized protein n=1 Tax=Stephania cephalantha TaxID=152367 RepID=A0AAP0J1D2_9MAGN